VKSSQIPPSTTSLPPSPQDEAAARSTRYLLLMGLRIVCIILMVVIQPFGWYTWVFGLGAVFLPYIAVVLANVSSNVGGATAENPELALTAAPTVVIPDAEPSGPTVLRIEETRPINPPAATGT